MASKKARKYRGKNKIAQSSTEEQISEPSIPAASVDQPSSFERRFAIQIPELSEHSDFLYGISSFLVEQLSRALFESLLNDYMESELFVIDGDSLIITCATNECLKRGQNLHFFFLVESFLLNLTSKGAKYSIVFFKDMEHLYTGCPDLISLRSQLMLHLENNTDITVHVFSNFLCEQWKEFIHHQALYFVMVSDEGLNNEQTCFLNLLILHALGNQINVVLTAGQDSDNLRVFGYRVSATYFHRKYLEANHAKIKKVFHKLITSFQTSDRNYCLPFVQHMEKVEKQVCHEISLLRKDFIDGSDIRIHICAISCSMTLRIFHEKQSTSQGDVPFLAVDEVADLCRMMCLSEALMIVLPLSQRAKSRLINANWNMEASLILNVLKRCEAFVLNLLRTECKPLAGSINWTHISNLSDDLLLKNIAYYCEKEVSTGTHFKTGKEIDQMFRHIWDTTLQLSQCADQLQSYKLRTTTTPFLSEDASVNVDTGSIQSLGLIPVRSDIIDNYAGNILKDLAVLTSNDPALTSLARAKSFDERIHWHSRRPLSDDYDRTKWVPIKDANSLRGYQKFQTFQRFYGKSLGMGFAKQIVVKSSSTEKHLKTHKAYGQKKETQLKKKDQIIAENLKKIHSLEEKKEIERWKCKESSLAGQIRRNIFFGMRQAERFFGSLQTKSIKFQAQFCALETCFEHWVSHCKARKDKETRDKRIVVEILKLIQAIVNDHQDMSKREEIKKMTPFLNQLGFENLAHQLQYLQVTSAENKESKYAVGVGSSRFQMQYMGPYLKKDERTDPDPRIQHFIPDTWQRELLDVVDNNESAVIVAPTSSGKTYASYYCMEKVLTESNDGVVVYVAPTKALVNQVVATVINQFTKDLPKGFALCGVFTRDYRCDALNSQVLVTVPQCLEILLLAPHQQAWVNRIKYMIFDEVHCLGGEIGAEVWEHILAMVRCPFLALSATISNPEHLTEWLQSVKNYWRLQDEAEKSTLPQKVAKKKGLKAERKSCRVRLVLHDRRYNDLEKFVCSVKDDKINFHHYHPCAALTIQQIKKSGIPKDLAFSPRESLQLYDAMVTEWPEWPRKEALDPENNVHLKDKLSITKIDADNYEEEVKKELSNWVKKGLDVEVSEVLINLRFFPSASKKMDRQPSFPQLVERLRQLDKLPALFFAFDIKLVEKLAKDLGQNLKENSEKSQTQKIVKEKQKLEMKGKRVEKTMKSSRKDEYFIKEATAASCKQKYETISKELPGCSYANYGAVDNETLLEMTEKVKTVRHSEELISLAERGIGYHHGSMDYKARRFVEMLFRMGHISVVTATSSLALGINMPCKSVVFLKDSSYLDALNYRQMAGRAGRRGLDLEGSVYFVNIPMTKVEMLIKANVPELRGQFPLSLSLVLRLMLLAAKADDKEDAKAKVLSVLKHSLMAFKHPVETQMLKMYFVFSLQFLVHEGYLDRDCDPLELTGLVTHLHYHEPSNFLFVSFLKKGLFHDLCKPSTKYPGIFPDSVMETLMLVLAHLFGREYILSQKMKYMGHFFQSKVFLEKLPDDFAAVVEEHNRNVALIFGQCILTASKLADMEKEYQLPLSKINFSGRECMNSGLVDHLMSRSEESSGISPFARLSGNTDHNLRTLKNVNSMMLQTIQIPQKYFPIFYLKKTDAYGRSLHINSYALDFFKHGSIKAIVTDNGFNEGDAYYKLKDFCLSLAAISVSMREMCEDKYDPVPLAFEQLGRKFRQKLDLVK